MVWGVIVYNARSPLVLICGTIYMTIPRYVYDIMQPHVLPLKQWLPEAIFQHHNAQLHTTKVSQDCLLTVTTRSQDLSLIEHIWDHLGWRVRQLTSLNELEARVNQIWNEMSQDIIQSLYSSMSDHIASCIRAREGATWY
ncbi:transposable element Tcb1 transposase [Trichonephila clavipes]|nr:transposable element Tcb1 transposase [Trichonephila clavipes]